MGNRTDGASSHWIEAASLARLEQKGKLIVKAGRKQVLLLATPKGIFACNNRCPHEGYPLMEGTLSDGCVLTCNWHNWKFDLESGKTLTGGDELRRYPVEVREGSIWLEVSDPPSSEMTAKALANLKECFEHNRAGAGIEYDRLAREIARLQQAGGDPLEALRSAIDWTYDRFEFGATHALAGAQDWLTLGADYAEDADESLVPLIEATAHLAWDSRLQPHYPFTEEKKPLEEESFLAAFEAERENEVVAQLRGFLSTGGKAQDLRRLLAQAALSHYADFGHSAIYAAKISDLISRLGEGSAEALFLALLRQMINASREDLIPEFRSYAAILERWRASKADKAPNKPEARDFFGLSARQAMEKCLDFRSDPGALYHALLGAAASNLLYFDRRVELASDNKIDDNVGWLTFTHAITFANAARRHCETYPDLWPQALLQMACFVGRNNNYVDRTQDVSQWRVPDPEGFFKAEGRALFDHGQFEYIVACHLVKVLMAVREEVRKAPDAPWTQDLLAATNRFFHTPIKRKHVLRTVRQSRRFVTLEG